MIVSEGKARDQKPPLTAGEARTEILASMSEQEFQAMVRQLAELKGWTVFTTWNSRHSPSGEPDLRLVHPVQKRVLWIELKVEDPKRGELSIAQEIAIETLRQAGAEVFIFRPSEWDKIVKVLDG